MKNNYHEKVIAVVQTANTKRYILVFGLFKSLIKVICRSFYTVQSYNTYHFQILPYLIYILKLLYANLVNLI